MNQFIFIELLILSTCDDRQRLKSRQKSINTDFDRAGTMYELGFFHFPYLIIKL